MLCRYAYSWCYLAYDHFAYSWCYLAYITLHIHVHLQIRLLVLEYVLSTFMKGKYICIHSSLIRGLLTISVVHSVALKIQVLIKPSLLSLITTLHGFNHFCFCFVFVYLFIGLFPSLCHWLSPLVALNIWSKHKSSDFPWNTQKLAKLWYFPLYHLLHFVA